MIKKEKLLEAIGFKWGGDGFQCVGCPKGMKFTMEELDGMTEDMFVKTMRQHEKHHPVKFEEHLFEFSDEKKTEPIKAVVKSQTSKVSKTKAPEPPPPPKKRVIREGKNPPQKPQTPAVIKKEPIAAPALPKKLLDAGLGTVLVSPKKAFLAAGGTEQQFAKEINFAVQHLMKNDYLITCAKTNPEYLVEAVKNIALTGLTLNPELRLGYLVPRKGKIYFSSSYMGKREIITRTGAVKDFYASLVYEKDVFEVQKGTNPSIKHIPVSWGDRGDLKGGYWVCELMNGAKSFDTMTKERIDEIKGRSESVKAGGQTPWKTDYDEMALKTVANWGFKFVPKTGISDDQIKALEVEAKYDNEVFEEWVKTQDKKADQFDEDGPAGDDHIQDAKIVD